MRLPPWPSDFIFYVEVCSPIATITSLFHVEVASSHTRSLPQPFKRFSKQRGFKVNQMAQSLGCTISDTDSQSKHYRPLLMVGTVLRVICSHSARTWDTLACGAPIGTWSTPQLMKDIAGVCESFLQGGLS